jgi:transcriptional regulator with XRE-family HTH domain
MCNKSLSMLEARTHEAHAALIQRVLQEKLEKNARYSLRALARDLGVSHTYLSLVMHGKKMLSQEAVASLNQLKSGRPVQIYTRPRTKRFRQLPVDQFELLSGWYHFAILELIRVKKFVPNVQWIAGNLGVKPYEVQLAVERLERVGLLKREGDRWIDTQEKLSVLPKSANRAMRIYHAQLLERAAEVLRSSGDEGFEKRQFTGMTMAINPKHWEQAKKRIRAFQRSMSDILCQGECEEVYHLAVQLFSLTDKKKKRGKKK